MNKEEKIDLILQVLRKLERRNVFICNELDTLIRSKFNIDHNTDKLTILNESFPDLLKLSTDYIKEFVIGTENYLNSVLIQSIDNGEYISFGAAWTNVESLAETKGIWANNFRKNILNKYIEWLKS